MFHHSQKSKASASKDSGIVQLYSIHLSLTIGFSLRNNFCNIILFVDLFVLLFVGLLANVNKKGR
jgi:hypothetical protein